MTHKEINIAIVGAGIAGITAAYYLARSGHFVTVFDEESHAGMRCSYANGGQLSVSNSETWHSWGNVLKGIKWMFQKDAPLLIRPSLDIQKAKWLAQFLYNTAKDIREKNTAKTIYMALQARDLYLDISRREHIEFDLSKSGILHFYKDQKYFDAARSLRNLYTSNGCEWEILSSKEVLELEPTLVNSDGIIGGVWTESDSVGDIHKFCQSLCRRLKTKYKVGFRYNSSVDGERVKTLRGVFDAIVIANGAESVHISRALGDRNTIYPIKGYSITINDPGNNLPKTSLLDDQAKIVTSTLGNRLRIAGTAELNGYNYDIRRDRLTPLLNWVKTNLPYIDTHDYSSWACLRPMTSDMMPMVTRSKVPGVYYHTGHGHLGWTVATYTATQLADLINQDFDIKYKNT